MFFFTVTTSYLSIYLSVRHQEPPLNSCYPRERYRMQPHFHLFQDLSLLCSSLIIFIRSIYSCIIFAISMLLFVYDLSPSKADQEKISAKQYSSSALSQYYQLEKYSFYSYIGKEIRFVIKKFGDRCPNQSNTRFCFGVLFKISSHSSGYIVSKNVLVCLGS